MRYRGYTDKVTRRPIECPGAPSAANPPPLDGVFAFQRDTDRYGVRSPRKRGRRKTRLREYRRRGARRLVTTGAKSYRTYGGHSWAESTDDFGEASRAG